MKVTLAQKEDKKIFDEFVASHSHGTFLQAWDWGNFQESLGKRTARYFFYEENKMVGATQIILHSTKLANYVYCPYGPLIADGMNYNLALQILTRKIKQDFPKILFARFEPTQNFKLENFSIVKTASVQPPETLIKNISLNEEGLLKSFHPKTRYNIKVAQKHGVKISFFESTNEDVLKLILHTQSRQNYRGHSKSYLKALWDFFASQKDNASVKVIGYLASIEGAPAAASLMIDFGQTRMYLFGGSNYDLRKFMAPYLLHFEAMKDAKNFGLLKYDFGATLDASGHTGGYARFKAGWNPDALKFAGTFDVPFSTAKYKTFSLLRTLNRLRLHVKLPFGK